MRSTRSFEVDVANQDMNIKENVSSLALYVYLKQIAQARMKPIELQNEMTSRVHLNLLRTRSYGVKKAMSYACLLYTSRCV